MKPTQKETPGNEVADFSKYTSHIKVPCFQPNATIDSASTPDDAKQDQKDLNQSGKGGDA
jgi:hypothetical protein